MTGPERRRTERIHLPEPLEGTLGDLPIHLVEIGLLGARAEVLGTAPADEERMLAVDWDGERIEILCRVARMEVRRELSELKGMILSDAGLEFLEAKGSSGMTLRKKIAEVVTRALELQKANARGESDWSEQFPYYDPERPRESAAHPLYVTCRLLENGQWKRSTILKPNQPVHGFTVRASTPEEQIEMLCAAFARGTEEQRHLIRLCAELSLLENDAVPPPMFR
ncbi:MAG TPA: hypothetical protein VM534_04205 [Thermoanaerobaculia bacterium]|nr:hypothetical protein [Thermoanaerobaculia bacterium]